jgi:hypothetical protein
MYGAWISFGIVGACVVIVGTAGAGFLAVVTINITTPVMVITARIPPAMYHFQVLNNKTANRKGAVTIQIMNWNI